MCFCSIVSSGVTFRMFPHMEFVIHDVPIELIAYVTIER